ncbi:CocE/NonD family hydrolase [Shimia sp. MMG029]|uniref:CocE/NonD family hydrolase n=1 Tax=Shimia sp. MMG029 TaxID=3021978 RepID=UPI0022FF1A77|nr:CocE/NonD family hydrolase [Shimia sp. MMG029]MDA5556651.1 CocE/NonD family hydrolase [Shimia sp. MMG029]
MQTVKEFPYQVSEHAHVQIPMPDGTLLSARIWRPETDVPLPAILEFLPYRKRDGTAERDALTHPYMAGHGYVCVRVDMRGCGDSQGLFDDEYSPQELSDGAAVINWLAAQEWCSGDVGMMGISWGGFNGLQIAALAPEPLKAVVSICSTVDRFADDIHYKGGVMLGENVGWASTVLGWFALPPDPEIYGDGWREAWLHRLENTPFLAEKWVQEQARSAYWKHGSVCEDYSAIKAAVLSVGGWHDGYRNTIAHLVENLDAPVKGLIGPWIHKYPHFAAPGPRIDFLGEMLRWWDRWLKGVDNGVEDLPDMRRWLMDSVPPANSYDERPGKWIGDPATATNAATEDWHLTGQNLSQKQGKAGRVIAPALLCGQAAGEYFPVSLAPAGTVPGELPGDQREDDALSCCFESVPLQDARSIVGAPSVRLNLTSDRPKAQIIARLCDVHPDGQSTLISHGVLNLRHRDGHETFVDLPVGEPLDVEVTLDHCAYTVPAGHSLRLALSSSYWPYVWPESELANLELHTGTIALPVRSDRDDEPTVSFDLPKAATPRRTRQLSETENKKTITKDLGTARLTLDILGDTGLVEDLETGLISGTRLQEQFAITDRDPNSAHSSFTWQRRIGRGDWQVVIDAKVSMRTDGESFLVAAELKASENCTEVFAKNWDSAVPRL